MGSLFSGSTESKVKIPEWLEAAARSNLGKAQDIASIGYTPYYGADVAAFNPMQTAGFQIQPMRVVRLAYQHLLTRWLVCHKRRILVV